MSNPLEQSAYGLQDRFDKGEDSFDVQSEARTAADEILLNTAQKIGLA